MVSTGDASARLLIPSLHDEKGKKVKNRSLGLLLAEFISTGSGQKWLPLASLGACLHICASK